MPQVIGGLLLNAGIGTGTAFTLFGSAVKFATVYGYVAYTALTAVALRKLQSSASQNALQNRLVNFSTPIGAERIIYGKLRVGGQITYGETTDDGRYSHYIITLAGHEVHSIDDIYLNDELVTWDNSGGSPSWEITSSEWADEDGDAAIRIIPFKGDQTAVSADLLAESESGDVDANFKGEGKAYIYVRFDNWNTAMRGSVPQITAVVRGKKVHDSRTSTTAYSANAALIIRDWVNADYGMGADSSETSDAQWEPEFDVCDETVTYTTFASEARYEINGSFLTTDSPETVLQSMLSACGGSLSWSQGLIALKTAYYTPPTITLTNDDIRGGVSIETRTSIRDNFNTVRATFSDANNRWVPSEINQIQPSAFLAEDNNVEHVVSVEMPYTTSQAAAERTLTIMLERSREQQTISATFSVTQAITLAVGDTVDLTLTDEAGTAYVDNTFEVEQWALEMSDGHLVVNMVLREASLAAYDDIADATAIVRANSTIDPRALADRYNIRTVQSNCLANYLVDHTVFNASTWTATRASISANAADPPSNGVDLADEFIEDSTASSTHRLDQSTTALTGGDQLFASIYAKRGSGTRNIEFRGYENGSSTGVPGIRVDLSDGSVIGTVNSPTSHGVEDAGGGWYRVWFEWTSSGSLTSTGVAAYLYNGGITYSGNGSSSIYLWGASLTVGSALRNFPGYEYPKVIKDAINNNAASPYNNDVTWHFKKSQKSSPPKPPRADDMCIIKGYLNNTPTYYSAAFVFDGQYWEPIDRWVGGEMLLDETVDTVQMVDSAITTAKVVDSAITHPKVDTDAIDTGNIFDEAVTSNNTTSVALSTRNDGDGYGNVFSMTVPGSSGDVILVWGQFVWNVNDAIDDTHQATARLKINGTIVWEQQLQDRYSTPTPLMTVMVSAVSDGSDQIILEHTDGTATTSTITDAIFAGVVFRK